MNHYHLDTDYLISFADLFHPNNVRVRSEIMEWTIAGYELCASSVAWQEFYSGKSRPRPPEITAYAKGMLTGGIVQFGEEQAEKAAELFHQIGRKKMLVYDCAIAAAAIVANAELATFNLDDFKLFVPFGLHIVNFAVLPNSPVPQKSSITQRKAVL